MKRILITGMPGVGKSSVVAELVALGHRAVETDYGDWMVPATDADDAELVWDPVRVAELLSTEGAEDELQFVSGCCANQGDFYDRFDHVILFSAPPSVIAARVTTRTNNPYGQRPGDLEAILEDQRMYEHVIRAGCDFEIDTSTMPVDDVVATVLAHVRATR